MKTHRKIIHHSVEYWQDHMTHWQQSQLSQRQYCENNNLGLSTFQKWKKKLYPSLVSVKPKPKYPEPFIEIPDKLFESESSVAQWDLELSLGNNMTLRLRYS